MARQVGLAVLAGGAASLAYARFEAEWFALRLVTVPVLPAGQPPWSILHLSDLHMSGGSGWLARRKVAWIRRLAALKPDLVVTTGDNLAQSSGLTTLLAALEPLLEHPGAFVFGSNDYYSASFKSPTRYLQRRDQVVVVDRRPDLPVKALRRELTQAGWIDLDNARARLTLPGGANVALVGLADPHVGWDILPPAVADDFPIDRSGDLAARAGGPGTGATGQAPAEAALSRPPDDAVRIGVVHAPYARALTTLVDDGAELILAGHTHGGQIGLPGFGALVSNSDLDPRQAKGLSRWPIAGIGRGGAASGGAASGGAASGGAVPGRAARVEVMAVNVAPDRPGLRPAGMTSQNSAWLHVSAGLGTSPYTPFRFATRPEATLLTLVPAI